MIRSIYSKNNRVCMQDSPNFYSETAVLIDELLSKEQFSKEKVKLAKKYSMKEVPTDIKIGMLTGKHIITKPVRTTSGVAPLAIMTAPFSCPHGKCTFCPGGPKSVFGDVPQSYTGKEPASLRAVRNAFDPYLQVFNRLEQYIATQHAIQKAELIIMGGTFIALDKEYKENFIMNAFKAMNDFGDEFFVKGKLNRDKYAQFFEVPGNMHDEERVKRVQKKILELKGKSILEKEQKRNETSHVRCIALCIETKPDWCFENQIDEMLRYGTTRVEVGIQTLKESVLKKTNRGHTLEDSKRATMLLKNAFLKVGYHMMPGLPDTSEDEDIEMFKELFANEKYMPDALKIYPCIVMQGTPLYELWKRGQFTPIEIEQAARVIAKSKLYIPKWCRVMRIQRDIPTYRISAGVNKTNLRQYVEEESKHLGISCQCIRCREPKGRMIDEKNIVITTTAYESSGGTEYFISAEDKSQNMLVGFCRLRISKNSWRPEIKSVIAGIRELHIYGKALDLHEHEGEEKEKEKRDEKSDKKINTKEVLQSAQHKGLGKKLMAEAERIAKEKYKCDKIAVISGIGVREYYSKLGYVLDGAYMVKKF